MNATVKTTRILVVLLFFLIGVFSAHSQSKPSYELFSELKAQYLSLRNTDAEIVRAGEWENLGKKFEKFADTNAKGLDAPYALFYAAVLYEELFEKFGGKDRAYKCVALLERLARDYPGHDLGDDGLLKRGDLFLHVLKDKGEAKRNFQEIVTAYPEGDMYEVAKHRLGRLESGDNSGEELEKPQTKSRQESTKPYSGERHKKPLIVIDPGHGGEDYGAVGFGGLLEKDVVLDVALELERLLRDELQAIVRLTRRSDVFVPLAERTNLANDFEADLFISLHTNASPHGKLSGLETFYLDNTDDAASKKLAERENASTRFEGPEGDLQYMLSDLIQNAKLDDSILFANLVHANILRLLKPKWQRTADLGVRKGPFYVLVGAHMPCILLEMFFIDHSEDGQRLGEKTFRKDIALGVFRGVEQYLLRDPANR